MCAYAISSFCQNVFSNTLNEKSDILIERGEINSKKNSSSMY